MRPLYAKTLGAHVIPDKASIHTAVWGSLVSSHMTDSCLGPISRAYTAWLLSRTYLQIVSDLEWLLGSQAQGAVLSIALDSSGSTSDTYSDCRRHVSPIKTWLLNKSIRIAHGT